MTKSATNAFDRVRTYLKADECDLLSYFEDEELNRSDVVSILATIDGVLDYLRVSDELGAQVDTESLRELIGELLEGGAA